MCMYTYTNMYIHIFIWNALAEVDAFLDKSHTREGGVWIKERDRGICILCGGMYILVCIHLCMCNTQAEVDAILEKRHEVDYKRVERDNILQDIDDLTDANEGLKRALDEAQQEVSLSLLHSLSLSFSNHNRARFLALSRARALSLARSLSRSCIPSITQTRSLSLCSSLSVLQALPHPLHVHTTHYFS